MPCLARPCIVYPVAPATTLQLQRGRIENEVAEISNALSEFARSSAQQDARAAREAAMAPTEVCLSAAGSSCFAATLGTSVYIFIVPWCVCLGAPRAALMSKVVGANVKACFMRCWCDDVVQAALANMKSSAHTAQLHRLQYSTYIGTRFS
eukprot:1160729-Pelagomonas_calceolata.AAC.19